MANRTTRRLELRSRGMVRLSSIPLTEVIPCLGHNKMTSGHLHADSDGKVVNRIQQKKEEGGFYQEHAEFWAPTLLLDSDDIEASKGEVLSGAHKSSGLPFGLPMESRD